MDYYESTLYKQTLISIINNAHLDDKQITEKYRMCLNTVHFAGSGFVKLCDILPEQTLDIYNEICYRGINAYVEFIEKATNVKKTRRN